jgi:hypothetical protein
MQRNKLVLHARCDGEPDIRRDGKSAPADQIEQKVGHSAEIAAGLVIAEGDDSASTARRSAASVAGWLCGRPEP